VRRARGSFIGAGEPAKGEALTGARGMRGRMLVRALAPGTASITRQRIPLSLRFKHGLAPNL
jgi:hypothetical protein